MKKLLHINAAPRGDSSRTLQVSKAFLDNFSRQYPDAAIDTLNLFAEHLPSMTVKQLDGKYTLMSGKDLSGELKQAWEKIEEHIDRFLSADAYLISTPMWNFSIPYFLKQYIDVIFQPKYLFRYTENGVEGMAIHKKMVVITSRGGDYTPGTPGESFDHQESYLKTAFGFVGITDITFIHAQPMDAGGPDTRDQRLKEAIQQAATLKL